MFAEQLFSRFPPPSEKVAPSEKAVPKDRTKGKPSVSPEIKVYINTYTKDLKIYRILICTKILHNYALFTIEAIELYKALIRRINHKLSANVIQHDRSI